MFSSYCNRPGIPAAVSLLQGMMEVLTKSDITQSSPQITELYQYICLAAPFGSPSETNPANLKLQMQFRKAFAMPKEKVSISCISSTIMFILSDTIMETSCVQRSV